MIDFFKKIFQKKPEVIKSKREYTSSEKIELSRLELHRTYSEFEGDEFYIDDNGDFIKVIMLGRYSYVDVDGSVYGRICETSEGFIINTNWKTLYNKKPHEWVNNLSEFDRKEYLDSLNIYTLDEINDKFYHKLDKGYLREEKLKQLGI
jgi:hypothetical protein